MSSQRKIRIKDFVADVRLRMSDEELTKKYDLSPEELGRLFRRLLDMEAVSAHEFQAWSIFCNAKVPLKHLRLHRRDTVASPLPVHDADDPNNRGVVANVSEDGVGISGIRAEPDEVKTLVIPSEQVLGLPQLVLQARCIWTKTDDSGNELTGFYLIDAPAGIWRELRNAVRLQIRT